MKIVAGEGKKSANLGGLGEAVRRRAVRRRAGVRPKSEVKGCGQRRSWPKKTWPKWAIAFEAPSKPPSKPLRGFTRQSESPNVHISGPRALQKHHENSTRRHREEREREREKKNEMGAGKKRAKFWVVRRRGVRRRVVWCRVVQGIPNQQPQQP